ncbi:MAG: DUF4440 domain-containing protein [Patescibacteria group bacterium]
MNELTDVIHELELSLLKPEVRSSYEQLNNLLADDFKEFGSSGMVYDKRNVLERLPTNSDKIIYTVSNFEVKSLSENLALSTFMVERVINDQEKVISLRSSLWKKEEGSWRIFFHQGTLTK